MIPPDKQIMVLLVSHPGITHKALYSILQSLPNTIIVATNGALTAYDHLERQQTNVVVIDANIPLLERLALLARIDKQFPEARTLVLTTTAKHHQILKDAGADHILLQSSSRTAFGTAVCGQ